MAYQLGRLIGAETGHVDYLLSTREYMRVEAGGRWLYTIDQNRYAFDGRWTTRSPAVMTGPPIYKEWLINLLAVYEK